MSLYLCLINASDASELSSTWIQFGSGVFQLGSARKIFSPARLAKLGQNELKFAFKQE